jgi:hypothetical protein
MRLFNRKNQVQRLLDSAIDALAPQRGIKARLPGADPAGRLKAAVSKDTAAKAGVVAGGLAGLTAASAGISSIRRRREGARDDS